LGQKRTHAVQQRMSALPPIATAKADIRKSSCLLYPQKRTYAVQLGMSALGQKRTFGTPALFDHLLSATGQGQRHSDAERFSGLQIDVQLDFSSLLHRQFGGLFAFENTGDINAS